MKMRLFVLESLISGFVLFEVGCNDSEEEPNVDDTITRDVTCSAGSTQLCTCPDGATGRKRCGVDLRWGPCQGCGGDTDTDTDTDTDIDTDTDSDTDTDTDSDADTISDTDTVVELATDTGQPRDTDTGSELGVCDYTPCIGDICQGAAANCCQGIIIST